MATGNRTLIGLQCQECQERNYVTEKNTVQTPEKLTIKKFCPHCNQRTEHAEVKKLH